MSSDARLVRRAAAGDQRAVGAIYRRYSPDLYRFCLAIVGTPEDAQDALQNTMVKVLRALPGEERRIELKPWLYRIAHNESVELLRRRRPSEELDPEQAPSRGADLAEDLAVRERLRRLIVDLGQLPERQRGALVMRELSGLGYEEIGAALGTSPAVARQTLYEARLSLHQMDAGREMNCDAVTRALSDADGRVTRRRDIRAHLRACPECRRFGDELEGRRADLAALSPLPAVAAVGLLQGLLGGAAGSGGAGAAAGGAGAGAAAGAAGAGGAASLGAAATLKAGAAVVAVAVVGVGAADRAGVVDVAPFGGGSQQARDADDAAGGPPAPAADGAASTVQAAAAREASAAGGGDPAGAKPPAAPAGSGPAPSRPPGAAAPAAGESQPRGRGHEKWQPSAADHGQQTAASHQANGKGRGKESAGHGGGGSSQPHPDHPPKPAKPPKPDQAGNQAKSPKETTSPKSAQAAVPADGKESVPKAMPADAATPAPQPTTESEEAPDKGKGPAFQP